MEENSGRRFFQAAKDNICPIPIENRRVGFFSALVIWFGITFTIVVMFTGYFFVPNLGAAKAAAAVILGSLLGGLPFLVISVMGQKTGLSTMTLSRGAFGIRGSVLPAALNVISLTVWTFLQSEIAGNALNYISVNLFGMDNLKLYIVLSMALVFSVTIFGYEKIEKFEKLAAIIMVIGVAFILYRVTTAYGIDYVGFLPTSEVGISFVSAMDMVAIYILAYTAMAADYSRNCKSVKAAIGGVAGLLLGNTLIILAGVLLVSLCTANQISVDYNPAHILGALGFGVIGSAIIFTSNSALSFAAVYSTTMSILNTFPKTKYPVVLTMIVLICTTGALFAGILGHVVAFVSFLGNLFAPLFAIIAVDFLIVRKGRYDVKGLLNETEDSPYHYYKGVNIAAFAVYFISAAVTCVWSFLSPTPLGVVIPSFLLTGLLYFIAHKLIYKK